MLNHSVLLLDVSHSRVSLCLLVFDILYELPAYKNKAVD